MLLTNTQNASFLLEENIYALKVAEANYGDKDGKPYIELTYEVLDGPQTGKAIKFQKLWLTEKSAFMFFQFLAAITGDAYQNGQQLEYEPGDEQAFVDKEFCAKIGIREFKKKDGSTGQQNEPQSVDYRFFHPIEAYTAMRATWDATHDTSDSTSIEEVDEVPF